VKAEIAEEEKDILYLEDLLDRARLDAMQELGKELAASRRELARLAEKLRKAPDEETKRQVLAEVERLRERIQDLMQRMAEMAKGIRDEHLNEEAVANVERQQDLLSQLSDIQRKLQSGKIDDALKQLDQLGQELDQLEKNLSQKADREQSGQYAEEAQKLSQAAQKLKQLEARERDLQKRTAQVRNEARAQAQKRFDQKGGKELLKKLRDKVEEARKGIKEIDPKLAERLGLEDMLEAADSRVGDLRRALESGDLDEAQDQAERAVRATQTLQGRLAMEQQLSQRYPGFARDPESVKKGLSGAASAVPPLQEVSQALQQLLPRDGQSMTPQQLQQLLDQEREQREISEQLQQARDQLSEVGKRVPIFGPQHEQMLQEAQDGMGRAQERLGRGEPRGAQAGEEQALEKLQQFQQAMQQMAKNQGGGKGGQGPRMPMPWGEPQGDGEGDQEGESDSMRHDRVEIPDAEASRGPQEFRKELLDAMKQQAPKKYEERVKQYYEELVK
jgi:myosin heavy subunit